MTAKRTAGKFIEYLFVRGFNFSMGLLPFRLRAFLTEQLGAVLYRVAGKYRALIIAHLKQAFPDKDQAWYEDIARKNFRAMGRSLSEFIQTPRINKRFVDKWLVIKPDTPEHRDVFKNGGMGILAHLGNWEWHGFLGAYIGEKPLYTMVKRHTNYWSNEYLEVSRERAGMRLIYVDQNPIIAVKRLRAGDFVAFTSDQDARGNGEFFPFLGKLASTFMGPAIVARNSKAPIYFVWSHRDEKKRLVFEYEKLDLPRGIDPKTQMEDWERAFTWIWVQKMEEKIRLYPEDYLWGHNRWKTQPENLEEAWEGWRKWEQEFGQG